MINLYEILRIPPDATAQRIQQAVKDYAHNTPDANSKVIQATQQWLLVPETRARYDAQLRQAHPDFFQNNPFSEDDQYKQLDDIVEYEYLNDEEYEYAPYLWNPQEIAIWSFLFALILPIMGAWLHALNWEELGESKLAKQNWYVVWGVSAFTVITLILMILTGFELPMWLGWLLWAIWFFALGKKQHEFIRQEFGNDYDKRSWQQPLYYAGVGTILGLIALFILVYLAMIAGIAHESLYPNQQ